MFAAIAAHKAAEKAFCDLLTAKGRLEREIPEEARQSDIGTVEETRVKSDDPRWIAVVRACAAASDEEEACARALLEVRPTTLVGLLHLLLYAEISGEGRDWPDLIASVAADGLEQLISADPDTRRDLRNADAPLSR